MPKWGRTASRPIRQQRRTRQSRQQLHGGWRARLDRLTQAGQPGDGDDGAGAAGEGHGERSNAEGTCGAGGQEPEKAAERQGGPPSQRDRRPQRHGLQEVVASDEDGRGREDGDQDDRVEEQVHARNATVL